MSQEEMDTLIKLINDYGDASYDFGDYQSECRRQEAKTSYDNLITYVKGLLKGS